MLYAKYIQRNGEFYVCDHQNYCTLIAKGYSGRGIGRNNPAQQSVQAVGPIPVGDWKIHPAVDHPRLGPLSLRLSPCDPNSTTRTGFYIHGDSPDGDASTGCIVLQRGVREAIRGLKIDLLRVR